VPDGAVDVVVVGGGPAGCSAALRLAAAGRRVLLCEAHAYPRDKLCGEFLSPECGPELEALGVWEAVRALAPERIDTACLTAPSGARWETRLPVPAWGLSRRALDAALAARAREAGVEVREGATVTGIVGNLHVGFRVEVTHLSHGADEGGEARYTVAARAVVAAHGKRAALDRALGRRFLARPQPFIALKRHFTGPPLPGRIELHTFPGGYCGMSALEGAAGGQAGAANVCLLAHASAWGRAAAAGSEAPETFVRWMRTQNPRLEEWLAQAAPLGERWLSIAQVPFGRKRAVVNDVFMTGDAAGLVAPLAGDGIAMALRGGALAAEHLLRSLDGGSSAAQARAGYARAWRREFGSRLRVGVLAQACLLRPAVFALVVPLLNAWPALGRFFVARTRDLRAVGQVYTRP
jgi:flavin-dependent dehydrogenase